MARQRRQPTRQTRQPTRQARQPTGQTRQRPRQPAPVAPVEGWKIYRPAIWLTMLGIAVALLVSPWYLCALPLGAALGITLKIERRKRRRR